ncbi:MAG: tetratricopeptide repeat protein [Planctomycetes bacterium]|nr:tetratricopeptide repeat protein [Planctomycetota bacterium]
MPRSSKKVSSVIGEAAAPTIAELSAQPQVDFELDFLGRILERHPRFVEALRCHASNLSAKKRIAESLMVERRIIQLRPTDALAHYNLACSHALLRQPDQALASLRKALELGYHDFRFILQDRDLDTLRTDPRFRKLLREFDRR